MFNPRRQKPASSNEMTDNERIALQEKDYNFTSIWTVKAPAEDVFAAISDYERWPEWWSSVESVEVTGDGEDQRVHSCWSAGPYSLQFDTFNAEMVYDEKKGSMGVTFQAEGDLNGTGSIICMPDDADTTHSIVEINWHVKTRLPWMNKAAPMLKGFFEFNHGRIMRQGGEEFNQYIMRLLMQHGSKEEL